MLEPFFRDRRLGVHPELFGVDQAHPEDVSELSSQKVLLFVGGQTAVFALAGRREVGLGEFSKLFGELQ